MFYSIVILTCKNGKWPFIRLNSLSIRFLSQWRVTDVFPKNAVFFCRIKFVARWQCPGFDRRWGKVFSFCHNPPRSTLGPIQSRPMGAVALPGVERPGPCFDHWLLSSVAYWFELQPPLPFVPTQHVQGRTLPLLGDSIVFRRVFHGFKGISSIFVRTQARCPVYSLCMEWCSL